MPGSRRSPLVIALVLGVLALLLPPGAGAASGAPSVRASVAALRKEVARLPQGTPAQKKARKQLTAGVRRVSRLVSARRRCAARSAVVALRKARAQRKLAAKRRARVTSAALRVEAALLSGPGTKACGGAARAPAKRLGSTVLASTPDGLRVRIALPAVKLLPKTGGGKTYAEAVMDGLAKTTAPGSPGVPTLADSFAIPAGAKVSLAAASASSYTLGDVALYPSQPSALDAAPSPTDPQFADKPFAFDPKAYASSKPVPSTAADAGPLGTLRDLDVGQLAMAGAQYTPKKKTLKVFTSMTIDVKFTGGPRTFGAPGIANPWNAPFLKLYGNTLTNGAAVLGNLTKVGFAIEPCGEQMLVVTSPALRAAADTLASARNAAGIKTRVVETGTGPGRAGMTADQIRAFVQGEVASPSCIRPSYLTIMGDTANVPTFPGDPGLPNTPSDFDYGLKFRELYLPNLAVGRIPAESLASATTMVAKITGYEGSPPSDAGFYTRATVTSYFQGGATKDERGFVRTAEQLRNGLLANGRTVDRIYDTSAANPLTDDLDNALPAAIHKPGFAWTGSAADVVTAVNAGRSLLVARDHGGRFDVSSPAWGQADIPSMTNGGALPVAWLIACQTGWLDVPGQPSLAELLLRRAGGGSVGSIAASRNSPSEVNNRLTMGLADAVFPNVLPTSGSSTPVRRMGDTLNSAKLHVILDSVSLQNFYSSIYGGGSPTGDIRNEQRLYNYFGDPSMVLWTTRPPRAFLSGSFSGPKVLFAGGAVAAGGVATVLENGVPVGKAFAGPDGSAEITPDTPIGDGKVELVLEQDGVEPSTVTLREPVKPPPPPARPDLVVTAVSSALATRTSPARTSITVKNQGDAASGAFSATVKGDDGQGGQATLTFSFAALAPGASQTQEIQQTTLYNTLDGVADSSGVVAESDETNNTGQGAGPAYKP